MYLDFYGFTEKPFTITPNPRFIFFSKIHKEAFALLLYGINNHFGFIELIGEVGTGKTTVLRTLLGQLGEDDCRTALIFNPSLSAVDLMRAVNHDYGIPATSGNIAELLDDLNRFLLRENAAGRTVVLVIDEAQNLAPDVLEQIRLISNLETETDKLIQIVLAGQPELGRLLAKPELRQLNQRIALRYHLKPLDREDSREYIDHRLEIAGGRDKVFFTAAAYRLIYRCSRGTPRLINMLCDRALLIGYTENSRKVTGRFATLAFRDIMLKPARPFRPLYLGGAVIILCALLFGSIFGYPSLPGLKGAATTAGPPPASRRGESPPPAAFPAFSALSSAAALKKTVQAELSVRSETKSAVQAFNALALLWRVQPVRRLNEDSPVIPEIRKQAAARGLVMTPFSGSLDDLIRLDSPALLAISPGDDRNRYLVALTGARDGNIRIAPPLLGRTAFAKGEFLPLWSGRAWIIWKNSENIPPTLDQGATGPAVKKLQGLLRKAGFTALRVNGVYDKATVRAIRDFQVSRGTKATGKAGPYTLMYLYKAADGAATPRLSEAGKGGRS
jgi:general secretion pathway protein A